MPTYGYRCDACSHEFDEFQSFTEEPLKKCPSCKKRKLQRLLGTGAAILFKGSGFYETDYRSESYVKAAKADQESTAPKDGSAGKDSAVNGTKGGDGGEKKSEAKSPKSKAKKADD